MLFNKSSCYFISVLIFFTSCISVTTSFRTFTNPYNKIPTANENLELMVIHDDERTSSLFYRFPSPLLTYKKSERDTFFRSSFRLVYRLREHPGNRKTGDSVSLLFKDAVRSISMHDVSGKVKLKVPQGKQFFLEVSVQDIHSGNRINEFLIINKMNRESAQNYRLLFDSVQSYSRYYVDKPTQLQLINEQNLNDSIIYAEFYIYKSEIAYVPFATPKTSNIKIKPDSVIYLSRSDNHYTYNLLHPGIYFFKTKKL